jgi:hypothetical protein
MGGLIKLQTFSKKLHFKFYILQPPYSDYNPIEDALPLWDHKTRPNCTGQACRASTFSTQMA